MSAPGAVDRSAAERYVDFAVNIGQTVALKYASGLPKPATKTGYQDQVYFTLCDGRGMSVPEFAAELIAREGIKPGEPFVIGKYQIKENQKKFVRWRVERIEAGAPRPNDTPQPQWTGPDRNGHQRPAQPEEPETPLAANLRRSAEIARARDPGNPPNWNDQPGNQPERKPAAQDRQRQAAPQDQGHAGSQHQKPTWDEHQEMIRQEAESQRPAAIPPPALRPRENPPPAAAQAMPKPNGLATQQHEHQHANGNSTAPRPVPAQPTMIRYEKAMEHFLVVAGRATRAAETTLGAEGGSVRFDSRDVAALATTLLIEGLRRTFIQFGAGEQS